MPPETERQNLETDTHQKGTNQPESNHPEHLINEGKIVRYTRAVMWLTGGLVFVGVVTVIVLIIHAVIFYETDQTARKSQRAFVAARGIETETIGIEPIFYSFSLVWENSGNTATSGLELGISLVLGAASGKEKWNLGAQGTQQVLLPKATLPLFGTNRFDGATINSLKNSRTSSFIYGFAKYMDIFGNRHLTLACFRLVTAPMDFTKQGNTKAISGVQCAQYNCADDDCKRYKSDTELKELLSYLN